MKKNYLILVFTLCCLYVNAQNVLINDVTLGGISTSTFQETPIDADDNYSYSQSIYLQSEINQAGNISKITYYTNGVLENSNDVVIYMAETPDDVFASSSGWIASTNLTQVYAGVYTVYNNEVSIILDTPFNYSNTNNLVIVVDENQDDSDSNDFITHNLGYSNANGRVIHYGNNFTNPDPASPPTGILDYYRPNIEIDFTPITCYPPSNIVLSNFSENTVDVNWASTATQWDYVVQVSGTGNPDAATPENVSSSSITVNNLTNNTEYELYLRSNCDTDGVSDWIGPIVFRTACGVVNDFSENFDSMPDELETPYCWTTIATSTGTAPNIKVNTSASQAYSPDNYYEMQLNNDDSVYLISPESLIIADGMHRIEFAAKVNSVTGSETTMNIGLMSDPTDENTYVELSSITLSNSSSNTNNYSFHYVNIPLNASANHLVFKPETNSSSNKIVYLDDVVVTTQPSCFEVLDVEATSITDVSFNLNITPDIQTQTEWELVVVQTDLNFNPALETPIVVNALTTNITTDSDGAAIIPDSPYRVFVRANCDAAGSDGTGYSSWFGPYDTRTACAPLSANFLENFDSYSNGDFPFCWSKNITSTGSPTLQVSTFASYAVSGSSSILMNTGNDANANVLLILPQNTIANDGAHRLEFYARKSNANTAASIIVGSMSDPLDATTFSEITEVPITSGGSTGEIIQYYVNLPASSNEYVVLKHAAGAAASIAFYIDDVEITDQPACPEVFSVSAENITASSVEVSWDFIPGQTAWEYIVQAAGTGEPVSGTSTTTNTLNNDFNSLSANTLYEIYVRADCDLDGFSNWVGPVNFITACVPESGDFSTSFEGFSSNEEIQPCWSSLIDPVSTSPYVRYSAVQSQEGTMSVRFYSGNNASAGIFLISPMLADFDNTKQITFQVYDDYNGGLEVGTMSDPTDASTFTAYQTYFDADMTDDAWDEKTITFDMYSGTDNYIAFKYIPASTFDYLYIDSFNYENNPSLGINTYDFNESISIYPNPVKNTLNINGNNITSVEIYSVNGKKVLAKTLNGNAIDVSVLKSGLYFINIKGNQGEVKVEKFIKY
ncbi:T9SS-dependent choice-of-anchor J family protein [Lacinutrix sp. 5H-3-7-4]|uniref:T9SS-dependent choice-of-anchor J family protein n=1 Tax=Lacinutrix sp. (strain 5H-3-7-4) TaxID=983544 RepID=UPI00020A379E|nr:choice-of-anchor J domain-containing protein [Lacinutrix sp. 5H-3-7-4]AEH00329.1 Fibronectin type III domain protein [Lacinutrix sp. 5H-3-7-4]